ncbi:unnamed protein product [Pleuronectes platessa]|uniref:Uncharacterized protein n=1 Tax=Pleuronectes platessa TaxID=8262 RepID=A0A9N7U3T8_PLEPL|nr:unnamed protein product [Pleuronectes platessa]
MLLLLLYAAEPGPLTVRLLASLQSDSAFSATSRGSARWLIPLISGCPPRELLLLLLLSFACPPPSLFIHKSAEPGTVPNRPQRRTGHREQRRVSAAAPMGRHCASGHTSCHRPGETASQHRVRSSTPCGG